MNRRKSRKTSSKKQNQVPVINPLSENMKDCKLVTTKKTKFYKYSTKNNNNPFLQDIPDDVIDRTIYENCCNCVCILLYTFNVLCDENILKYLISMNKTITNVKMYLKNTFLVRIYLDPSVYLFLENKKNNKTLCEKLINRILSADNVEIYSYYCKMDKSIYKQELGKSRAYRLLPLIDKTVNLCAIREADGFVTKQDCHNLKIFLKSPQLFYLPKLNFFRKLDYKIGVWWDLNSLRKCNTNYLYSYWLNKYCFADGYFADNKFAYNILCGILSSKLKFTEKFFNKSVAVINKFLVDKNEIERSWAMDELIIIELHKTILSYKNIFTQKELVPSVFDPLVFSDGNNEIEYSIILATSYTGAIYQKIKHTTVTLFLPKKLIAHYTNLVTPKNNKHQFVLKLIHETDGKYDYSTFIRNTIAYIVSQIDELVDYKKINKKCPVNLKFNLTNIMDIFDLQKYTYINKNLDEFEYRVYLNILLNIPYNCLMEDIK